MNTMNDKPYYKINSCAKTMRILELLADKGNLTPTETASFLGFNRSTCHRFLVMLKELGYVVRDNSSRYRLSFKIFELGMKVNNKLEIKKIAYPFMMQLAAEFNETVNLGYWAGMSVVHVEKLDTEEVLRIDVKVGSLAPAYCTGLGKAILAHLPAHELEAYLNNIEFRAFTENTIVSKEELVEELKKVRERGFAIDDEELAKGLRCVAAPVLLSDGYPLHSISIAGPSARITHRVLEKLQDAVPKVARALTECLSDSNIDER